MFRNNLSIPSSWVKQSKNNARKQPTKGVTKGTGLSRMKVNPAWSVWPFLHLITMLDSKTATFQNNLVSANNIQQSLTLPESSISSPMALIFINTQAWSYLILRKPTIQYGLMAYSKNLFHFTYQIIFSFLSPTWKVVPSKFT